MNNNLKCSEGVAIVIFGVTGDLTTRKLLPALYENARAGRLQNATRSSNLTQGVLSVEVERKIKRTKIR